MEAVQTLFSVQSQLDSESHSSMIQLLEDYIQNSDAIAAISFIK